MKALDKKNQK